MRFLGALLALSLALPVWAQKVEPAPEYETVFQRQSGWTGADGTYSYPQGGPGLIVWGFSDTFLGEVVSGARQKPYKFVNNSFVLQQDQESFVFPPAADTMFKVPDATGGWFWLFDGTSDHILLGQFDGHGDGGFGFRQTGLWIVRYALRQPEQQMLALDLKRLPFFETRGKEMITFGPAILETPEWTYIYGVRDGAPGRQSVVARAKPGQIAEADEWRFFDGKSWATELWSCAPLFTGAAMEASVHRTRSGGYLYVGTDAGGMGSDIICRSAPSPEGPWSEPTLISKAPEHRSDVFAYNAKAHPELSRAGRLLISYNVNTSDLKKVEDDADIYRPRFLWWTPPNPDWLPAP